MAQSFGHFFWRESCLHDASSPVKHVRRCVGHETSNGLAMASNLLAMATDLIAMASNLLAMASNLIAMASNQIVMASNLFN